MRAPRPDLDEGVARHRSRVRRDHPRVEDRLLGLVQLLRPKAVELGLLARSEHVAGPQPVGHEEARAPDGVGSKRAHLERGEERGAVGDVAVDPGPRENRKHAPVQPAAGRPRSRPSPAPASSAAAGCPVPGHDGIPRVRVARLDPVEAGADPEDPHVPCRARARSPPSGRGPPSPRPRMSPRARSRSGRGLIAGTADIEQLQGAIRRISSSDKFESRYADTDIQLILRANSLEPNFISQNCAYHGLELTCHLRCLIS